MECFDIEYNEKFNKAFELYINGNWRQAVSEFDYLIESYTFEDSVSLFISNYIKSLNNKPPQNWKMGRIIRHKK